MSGSTGQRIVRLPQGECYVTRDDEMISTVLGSCVAACMRDPVAGIGGMNHFLLPIANGLPPRTWQESAEGRYGSYAMERLVNEILEGGGRRERLEAKIFGGGCILEGLTDVGAQNARFVKDYLRLEGIGVAAENLGGPSPRRVHFYPRSGRARVKRLLPAELEPLARRERALLSALRRRDRGRVEFF